MATILHTLKQKERLTQMKEEGHIKKDITTTDIKEVQTDGTQTNFYGKLMKGMSDKQKKIILVATAVSVFAGIGIYSYYKIRQSGLKIKIGKD